MMASTYFPFNLLGLGMFSVLLVWCTILNWFMVVWYTTSLNLFLSAVRVESSHVATFLTNNHKRKRSLVMNWCRLCCLTLLHSHTSVMYFHLLKLLHYTGNTNEHFLVPFQIYSPLFLSVDRNLQFLNTAFTVKHSQEYVLENSLPPRLWNAHKTQQLWFFPRL